MTNAAATHDVIVVGGGSAGVAAAVSAARAGGDVVLVERHGFLGGTMTAVSLGSLCGYFTVRDEELFPVVGGIATELVERLIAADGAGEPVHWLRTASIPYEVFPLKVVLDDLVREAGVEVLLHALVTGVELDGNRLTGVVAHTKEGAVRLRAPVVVDCSGDADVVALGEGEFLPQQGLQFPTAMFRFAGVDTQRVARISRSELHEHLERAVAAGLDLPRTAGGIFSLRPGIAHVNITRVAHDGRAPNPLAASELSAAEMAGRRQVLLYERAFREYVPGFENAFVLDTGATLGIRESRRIAGGHVLTVEEVLGAARFPDAIACGSWPVEEHTAGRATRWVWLDPGSHYQIPLRCLLPTGVRGVIVAGRCLSATHDAHASVRVTAQCLATGEAAGVLATQAARSGEEPHRIPASTVQRVLADRGAVLGSVPV